MTDSSKKGVEMSLNLIILIVIGLIILSLLIYIAVKYARSGDADLSSCQAKHGRCDDSCDTGESSSTLFSGGCGDNEVCCIKSGFGGE